MIFTGILNLLIFSIFKIEHALNVSCDICQLLTNIDNVKSQFIISKIFKVKILMEFEKCINVVQDRSYIEKLFLYQLFEKL